MGNTNKKMWGFIIDQIPMPKLEMWAWWLTVSAIVLPILGGVCGWIAFEMSEKVSRHKEAQMTARITKSEAAAKPRAISEGHIKDFIELTKGITNKVHIKVVVGITDGETERYAKKIRDMLDAAGFGVGGEGVIHVGDRIIAENQERSKFFLGGYTPPMFSDFDVAFQSYGKSSLPYFIPQRFQPNVSFPEFANGLPSDVGVFVNVGWVFSKIEIQPSFMFDDGYLKPGEFAVFVPQKVH